MKIRTGWPKTPHIHAATYYITSIDHRWVELENHILKCMITTQYVLYVERQPTNIMEIFLHMPFLHLTWGSYITPTKWWQEFYVNPK